MIIKSYGDWVCHIQGLHTHKENQNSLSKYGQWCMWDTRAGLSIRGSKLKHCIVFINSWPNILMLELSMFQLMQKHQKVSHQKNLLLWTYIFGKKRADTNVKFDCAWAWCPINSYKKDRKSRGNETSTAHASNDHLIPEIFETLNDLRQFLTHIDSYPPLRSGRIVWKSAS